jgi:hypothetical protein
MARIKIRTLKYPSEAASKLPRTMPETDRGRVLGRKVLI